MTRLARNLRIFCGDVCLCILFIFFHLSLQINTQKNRSFDRFHTVLSIVLSGPNAGVGAIKEQPNYEKHSHTTSCGY